MALSDWVAATATVATLRHLGADQERTVATVATVAVADPTENGAQRSVATPEQAAELRELIAEILTDDSDADRAEALAVALADPDPALTSFRLLSPHRNSDHRAHARGGDDDRRRCIDCEDLSPREHRCLAAWRGEHPGNAARTYHPVVGVPRRCECYKPQPTETDQRGGAERWPHLIADAKRMLERSKHG